MTMHTYEKVAELDELADGELLAAECGELPVLLLRRDTQVFALLDRCPHRGGPLSEGCLENDMIRCPWHGALVDPVTGMASPPAQSPAECLEVRVEDDGSIEVAV